MSLNIEVGKKYKCRNGDIVKIDLIELISYPPIETLKQAFASHNGKVITWVAEKDTFYYGRRYSLKEDPLDLISEHIEDEYVKVEDLVSWGKYELEESSDNPHIFLCNTIKDYGIIHDRPLKFVDKNGDFTSLSLDVKIKKHILNHRQNRKRRKGVTMQ